MTWTENFVLTDMITHAIAPSEANIPEIPVIDAPTSATFKITDTKLYVPVVTLSTENDNKLSEQLQTEFKRTIK